MTSAMSRIAPLLVLIAFLVVFLYLTQPAPLPAPVVFPDHNLDPSVIGPALLP